MTNLMIKYLFAYKIIMMCDFSCLRCWSTFPGHFQPRATSLVIQKQLRNFQTTAVTLVGESTYLSLIASSNKQDMTGQSLLVEIPINLDIKVKVMQPKDNSDAESLSKQTYEL